MLRIVMCALLVISSQSVLADAEADIAYRQGVYKVVGGHMSGMGTILRNQMRMDELAYHMRGMANVAELVPTLFPEGSGEGKTDALPEIWENPKEFQAKLDDFTAAAKRMGELAGSSDMRAIGGALKTLGGTCKGCHDDFKAD